MYVKIEDVREMSEVIDQEVMGAYIVCELSDGSYYCTRSYHSKEYVSVDLVPFVPARDWMVSKFIGVRSVENDQLEDERIARLAHIELEECPWTDEEYRASPMDDLMPGAFEPGVFELRGVSL